MKKIVQWLIREFNDQEGIELTKDDPALQRLMEGSEKAKVELSTLTQSYINLPFISVTLKGPKHLEKKINKRKF